MSSFVLELMVESRDMSFGGFGFGFGIFELNFFVIDLDINVEFVVEFLNVVFIFVNEVVGKFLGEFKF